MEIEKKIAGCEYNLKQIRRFNPDPFYVNHFFKAYIQNVIEFYDEILNEVNKDFGLFLSGNCTIEKFENKCIEKNDQIALNFLTWYIDNYKNEHNSPYPKLIHSVVELVKEQFDFPKISVKMLIDKRYINDFTQEIKVGLKNEKLKSKEELQIEIRRQIPVFLELVNEKRKKNNEPKASETQIFASTFLVMKDFDGIEIPYACQVYIPVMIRILSDSRKKIKELINSY